MKYVINILAAVILLASCTKTEVTYDSPSEIAFAPVEKNVTKADADAQYYNGPGFYVFAAAGNIPYFDNIYFKQSGSEYVGSTTQYWPNKTDLKFAGYTSNASNPGATYESDVLTLTYYTQDINHDLMWFFTGDVERNTDAIEPLMMHACSKITIKITGQDACGSWPINSITLNGLKNKADLVSFESSGVTWDTDDTTEDATIYSEKGLISAKPEAEAIVIPQEPVTLTINYKNPGIDSDQISLAYNDDAEWQAGVHYTYTLNFLNPYKIEFSVSKVDPWGDGGTITMQ